MTSAKKKKKKKVAETYAASNLWRIGTEVYFHISDLECINIFILQIQWSHSQTSSKKA